MDRFACFTGEERLNVGNVKHTGEQALFFRPEAI